MVGNLLRKGSVATANWGWCYKVWQLYYKMGQFLQSSALHRPKVHEEVGQKSLLSTTIPLIWAYLLEGQMEALVLEEYK